MCYTSYGSEFNSEPWGLYRYHSKHVFNGVEMFLKNRICGTYLAHLTLSCTLGHALTWEVSGVTIGSAHISFAS